MSTQIRVSKKKTLPSNCEAVGDKAIEEEETKKERHA